MAYEHDEGYDCQDGGWNPEEHGEEREEERAVTAEEKAAEEKMNPKEKAKWLKELRLEGPHEEEPNQEEESEESGFGPGLSDVLANQLAEEQANIVTDPLLDGWQDESKHEVTDLCRDVYAATAGPKGGEITGAVKANLLPEAGAISNATVGNEAESGRYYLNNLYNLATESCVGGVALIPASPRRTPSTRTKSSASTASSHRSACSAARSSDPRARRPKPTPSSPGTSATARAP